jgi:GTP-binding protein
VINDSPFFGKEGKFVSSIMRQINKRIRENLAMKMGETDSADKWFWSLLHLSVLIEMRERGYELQIGQPQVIIKEIDGKKCQLKS